MFYFCKNDKTAILLTLAILLIFSEKESSKIGECYKSYFLKQNMTLPAFSESYTLNIKIRKISIMLDNFKWKNYSCDLLWSNVVSSCVDIAVRNMLN